MKYNIENLIKFMRKYKLQQVIFHFLAIIVFAVSYYIMHLHLDNAFKYDKETEKDLDILDFFYFSLVTQSTVGYCDITPIHNIPRMVCMIQIMSIYVIVLVALLN